MTEEERTAHDAAARKKEAEEQASTLDSFFFLSLFRFIDEESHPPCSHPPILYFSFFSPFLLEQPKQRRLTRRSRQYPPFFHRQLNTTIASISSPFQVEADLGRC